MKEGEDDRQDQDSDVTAVHGNLWSKEARGRRERNLVVSFRGDMVMGEVGSRTEEMRWGIEE